MSTLDKAAQAGAEAYMAHVASPPQVWESFSDVQRATAFAVARAVLGAVAKETPSPWLALMLDRLIEEAP